MAKTTQNLANSRGSHNLFVFAGAPLLRWNDFCHPPEFCLHPPWVPVAPPDSQAGMTAPLRAGPRFARPTALRSAVIPAWLSGSAPSTHSGFGQTPPDLAKSFQLRPPLGQTAQEPYSPRRVLSPGTLGDDVSHEIETRHWKI